MQEYPQELFLPLPGEGEGAESLARPGETYWQNAWRRLKKNRLAMAGLAVILVLTLLALMGPLLTPFSYSDQILSLKNKPPGYTFYARVQSSGSAAGQVLITSLDPLPEEAGSRVERRTFWFGSDSLGRDLFSRNWYGARISLAIGLVTAFLVFLIGLVYGGISGYLGGWVDEAMMRLVEILSAVPFLLYVILLMVLLEPGLKTIFIALGAVYWLPLARTVRGQVLALKEQEYVLAARALGAGSCRLIFRHLLPNALGPVIVYVTLAIPDAIFTEAWLSFLGLGVAAPIASWGGLASDGIQGIRSYPWQLFFPAFFVSLTMLAFNVFGDGLGDALDPRQKE